MEGNDSYFDDVDLLLAEAKKALDSSSVETAPEAAPVMSRRQRRENAEREAHAAAHRSAKRQSEEPNGRRAERSAEPPSPKRRKARDEDDTPKHERSILNVKRVSAEDYPSHRRASAKAAAAPVSREEDEWDDPFVEEAEEMRPSQTHRETSAITGRHSVPEKHVERPAPARSFGMDDDTPAFLYDDEGDDDDDSYVYEDEPPVRRQKSRQMSQPKQRQTTQRREQRNRPKPPKQPKRPKRKERMARSERTPDAPAPRKKGEKKSGKNKGFLILMYAVLAACVVGLCIVVPKIISTINDYREARMEYKQVSESALFEAQQPTREQAREVVLTYINGPQTEAEVEEEIDEYISNWVPIDVDWDYLRSVNSEVIGWIYCEGTNINYPVTQTTNNYFYLSRTINKTYSGAGTVFANYQSTMGNKLSHFIVYGHHMKDDSMFGGLDKYKKVSYYNDHPCMYFLTPDSTYKVVIFSGHIVESAAKNFPLLFANNDEYQNYLNQVANACDWGDPSLASTDYQLITLVTCDYTYTYTDPRFVVHGMLEPVGGAAYTAMKEAQAAKAAQTAGATTAPTV